MFFNSFNFIGFFLIVLFLLSVGRLVGRSVTIRNVILLVCSYWFYGAFNVGFTVILAFVTTVNYLAGKFIINTNNLKNRNRLLAFTVVLSLLPLIFYKYAFFLCKSFNDILHLELSFELLDGLILPVGISFFTFQALSYTIDIYRGKIAEKTSFLDFALFVSFFPTILSGPIEKARNLLPQIQRYYFPTCSDVVQGICIFIWGLFKKIIIADRLAYYVDWAYDSAQYESGLTLAVSAIFYSIQIYCDFSGYSDMALGVAKALGFNVTKNFHQPYFSRTLKEFWHKWHIALTSWFTEYVYFSLGGSRVKSKIRWIINISAIFILSGIWHGAAWNYIVWGVLHTLYYLSEHFLGFQNKDVKWNRLTSVLSGLWLFLLATIAWIFFRVETFDGALYILNKIFCEFSGGFSMGASSFTFATTILMLIIFISYEYMIRYKRIIFDVEGYDHTIVANIIAVIPMLLLMGMFGRSSDSFVYFQF